MIYWKHLEGTIWEATALQIFEKYLQIYHTLQNFVDFLYSYFLLQCFQFSLILDIGDARDFSIYYCWWWLWLSWQFLSQLTRKTNLKGYYLTDMSVFLWRKENSQASHEDTWGFEAKTYCLPRHQTGCNLI